MKTFRKCSYVFLAVSLVFVLMFFFGQLNSSETGEREQSKAPQFVTAQPGSVTIDQRDGTQLTVMKTGDEVINYTRTSDGYTVFADDIGIHYYAMPDENRDLILSSVKANDPDKRSKNEEKFLAKIQKYLEFSQKQKKEKKDKWKNADKVKDDASLEFGPINDAFPTTGTRNMLLILADFSDWSFVKTNNDFDNIMNVGTTSFKAFYQDNSYGALNINTDVVGPYTINMTMAQADANIRSFISKAIDAAENDGVDFSLYDNDSDGNMDALYVIHAGYGEEYSGAPTWYIWSHSWSLSTYSRTYDGVYISEYATSPELRNLSGETITAIGVICHEMGHNLGAPDYYDTDGTSSGGSAWDLKSWDVMASGSWNNSGDTPSQHNMYTKWKFGWSNPVVLNTNDTLTVGNTLENNTAYRIDTTTNNEFFILENRQKIGWDTYIGGHGLCIFHIDGNYIDSLFSNAVNVNPSHQGVDLEEADDLRSSSNYGGDPFPGTTNNMAFTDTTTPNAKSWAGNNTNKPVTDILENSGVITFDVLGGSGPPQPPVADFSSDVTLVQMGNSVSFTDTSLNSPTSWSWTFEGGTPATSTAQNPTVTYNTIGTYTVTLVATNAVGSDTETKVDFIDVQEVVLTYCDSLGSDFSYEYIGRVQVADLDNSSAGSSYTDFTNLTANLTAGSSASVTLTPVFPSTVYTEYWKIWIDYNIDGDFEDAGEEVFSASGTSVVSGNFTVPSDVTGVTRMRVTMKYNAAPTPCETFAYGEVEDYTVDISGGVVNPPVADFSASSTTVNEGDSVTFTDLSTNNPDTWDWTFAGGTPSTSTVQNPSVTYNTAGTYDVTLVATNSGGSDTETKVGYITVMPAGSCIGTVTNPGFETGTTSGWTEAGSVTISTDVHSGSYALGLDTTGSGVEQVITGLCPNTSYTVSLWGKAKEAGGVYLGVKNYGGTEQTIVFTDFKAFAQQSITFTTGASDTSATIFVTKTASKFGGVVDDFTFVKN
jgi:M6 family metalloprotease-like protein